MNNLRDPLLKTKESGDMDYQRAVVKNGKHRGNKLGLLFPKYPDFLKDFNAILAVLSSEFSYLSYTGAVTELTGYSEDELCSSQPMWSDLVYCEDKCLEEGLTKRVRVLSESRVDAEYRIVKRNGEIRWVNDCIKAVYEVDELLGFQRIIRDITREKLALLTSQKSEQLFSNMFESDAALMSISSLNDGTNINVNKRFLKTLGYTRDEVIGRSFFELEFCTDPDQWDQILNYLKTFRQISDYELKFRTKQGDYLYGLFSAQIISLDSEQLLFIMMNDITGT